MIRERDTVAVPKDTRLGGFAFRGDEDHPPRVVRGSLRRSIIETDRQIDFPWSLR